MKFIYATSIAFSNKLANRVQVHSMAKQLQKNLGDNFVLGINYKNVDDKSINIECFNTNKSYKLAWRYLKFIKKNGIDYVYCREARLFFFICFFNKLFFRKKLKYIYEIHALLERGVIDSLVDKFLSKNIHKFVFVTKNLEEKYLEKYGVNKDKSMVEHDGVDLDIFNLDIKKNEVRKNLNLPQNKKILVYTGKFKTMGMDKGISDIMRAVKILNNKEILFVAIGGSDDEIKYYERLAEELSISDRVKLIGLSPQSDLALYQKAADVLLMPFPKTKHYMYYMSPLKMFEYMAGKRPIIATDLPSVKEVLNDSSAGSTPEGGQAGRGNAIIVKPDNPEDLANGIKKALEDNNLVNNITENAFQDVWQYTWERRVERILGFVKLKNIFIKSGGLKFVYKFLRVFILFIIIFGSSWLITKKLTPPEHTIRIERKCEHEKCKKIVDPARNEIIKRNIEELTSDLERFEFFSKFTFLRFDFATTNQSQFKFIVTEPYHEEGIDIMMECNLNGQIYVFSPNSGIIFAQKSSIKNITKELDKIQNILIACSPATQKIANAIKEPVTVGPEGQIKIIYDEEKYNLKFLPDKWNYFLTLLQIFVVIGIIFGSYYALLRFIKKGLK